MAPPRGDTRPEQHSAPDTESRPSRKDCNKGVNGGAAAQVGGVQTLLVWGPSPRPALAVVNRANSGAEGLYSPRRAHLVHRGEVAIIDTVLSIQHGGVYRLAPAEGASPAHPVGGRQGGRRGDMRGEGTGWHGGRRLGRPAP